MSGQVQEENDVFTSWLTYSPKSDVHQYKVHIFRVHDPTKNIINVFTLKNKINWVNSVFYLFSKSKNELGSKETCWSHLLPYIRKKNLVILLMNDTFQTQKLSKQTCHIYFLKSDVVLVCITLNMLWHYYSNLFIFTFKNIDIIYEKFYIRHSNSLLASLKFTSR